MRAISIPALVVAVACSHEPRGPQGPLGPEPQIPWRVDYPRTVDPHGDPIAIPGRVGEPLEAKPEQMCGTVSDGIIEKYASAITSAELEADGSAGQLPPGLAISSQGVIYGTPTQAGDFNFRIKISGTCQGKPEQQVVPLRIRIAES